MQMHTYITTVTQNSWLSVHINYTVNGLETMPQLRHLRSGLSLRRPRLNPRPVHMCSVVDKVLAGQISL